VRTVRTGQPRKVPAGCCLAQYRDIRLAVQLPVLHREGGHAFQQREFPVDGRVNGRRPYEHSLGLELYVKPSVRRGWRWLIRATCSFGNWIVTNVLADSDYARTDQAGAEQEQRGRFRN